MSPVDDVLTLFEKLEPHFLLALIGYTESGVTVLFVLQDLGCMQWHSNR